MDIIGDSYVHQCLSLYMIRVGRKIIVKEEFQILQGKIFITSRLESMGYLYSTNLNIKYF